MSHSEQICFCLLIKNELPSYFQNAVVLDVGSFDVNGNNRYLFENCRYTGLDVAEGANVDVVSLCHEFKAPDETFDTIISTECLEHDKYYKSSLNNIIRMLKNNGLLLFTCATTGRLEHGTLRSDGGFASPLTSKIDGWGNYYKNLTDEDIKSALNVSEIFEKHRFFYNPDSHDLYFFEIKKKNFTRRWDNDFKS